MRDLPAELQAPAGSETSPSRRTTWSRSSPASHEGQFEINHIVSLELGGSNDIANLFPEKAPGYHVKDKLENRLHDLVCSGAITLRTARGGIASNWKRLYRKVYSSVPRG